MTRWRLLAVPVSGFLVGGLGEPPRGVHAASAFFDDPSSGRSMALLPGSSAKGVLREAFRRFSEARTGEGCATAPDCRCPACRLFGTSEQPGKIAVRSALVPAQPDDRTRVAIARSTSTAAREGKALWSERRAWGEEVSLEVETTGALDPEEAELVELFWAWLRVVGLSVGRGKSTGSGLLTVRAVNRSAEPKPRAVHPDGRAGPIRPWRLVGEFLEPARIVGLRQREFFRDTLDAIPSATLRGAIGWALARRGDGDVATDLFRSAEPVRIGTGYAVDPDRSPRTAVLDPVPWLSVAVCRGSPRHRVNLALHRLAASLTSQAGFAGSLTCPSCGALLDAIEGMGPPTIVIGRTAIEPRVGRVAEGMLYYEVAVKPGARFVAHLLARDWQVDAIGSLEEVWIGGRKRSGQGRARLAVEPLAVAPLESRLDSTRRALAELGVTGREIAVLGFLGDAAFARPPRQELERRGLQVVTAELRTVTRGGWDEERNTPRAVRDVVRGGSWIAVQLRGERALEELEAVELTGIEDPAGTEPALVRVRSDWEVVEVPEPAAADRATVAAIDEQIREVRDLCRSHQRLPERSQLQTLLRFAQSTDSPSELLLFIEYQASRDQLRPAKEFLVELARRMAGRFADDIGGARRYLGWVVRAANVEQAGPGGPSRGR